MDRIAYDWNVPSTTNDNHALVHTLDALVVIPMTDNAARSGGRDEDRFVLEALSRQTRGVKELGVEGALNFLAPTDSAILARALLSILDRLDAPHPLDAPVEDKDG